MAFVAPISANKDFGPRENPEPGMHMARIFRIVDIGTHKKKGFQGAPDKMVRQVRVDFELPLDLLTQGDFAGQPMCIGETFSLSTMSKAALRLKVLNPLVPGMTDDTAKKYDLTNLIGKECLINIVTAPNPSKPDQPYHNIGAVTPLMKGQAIPKEAPANPVTVYQLGDAETFERLPKWLKTKVLESDEMQRLGATGTEGASDIPF